MLEELSIRDFAIIERVSIRFEKGLNLLTGETGAGKSILIGALGFLLGGKADTGIIRAGAEETLVSGLLDASGSPEALAWLAERGIEAEDGAVVVRRGLRRNGRGAVYIQNAPATRQDLADLTSFLVDIHGQHEHQSLMKVENHRRLLDRFARTEDEANAFARDFADLSAKRRSMERMAQGERERAREIELLRFAVDEIRAAKPRSGEEDELRDEERRLAQFEKLRDAVLAARDALTGAGDAALPALRRARSSVEAAQAVDPRLGELARRVDDSYYELEDVADALRAWTEGQGADPARLEAVEERLAQLQKLRKKYGPSIEDVIAYGSEGEERLERLENWEEDREALLAEIAAMEKDLYARALALSDKRRAAAAMLEERIVSVVRTLGMPHARFSVRLARKEASEDGKAVVGQWGVDEIEFLIAANKGEAPRELARIASGGELSRVMLALKTAFAESDTVGTLLFDEIDTGIGGEVALSVGEHLQTLARARQVLCVTHLASIAARADNHYRVEKAIDQERTTTRVSRLEGEERAREIARMLAGDPHGGTSLAHAAELLGRYAPRGATNG